VPLVRYIPDNPGISFMRLRRISFPLSALLSVISVAAALIWGFDLGIDFKGGTLVEVQSTRGAPDIGAVRGKLIGLQVGDVQIQEFGAPTDLLIRVEATQNPAATVDRIRQALGDEFTFRRVETIGPSVSQELVQGSTIAVLLGIMTILAYLWFRFEWQFAFGAVITTMHDLVLTIGFFAIFQLDFDLTSIAAILTIIGYSVNDTVVIYDRIRDMLRRYKRMPIAELLDVAVNATFSRTLIVAATTFLATLALYFFGGEVIRVFSIVMLFGVVVGTYSTIFIAAPLLIYFGVRTSTVTGAAEQANQPAAQGGTRASTTGQRQLVETGTPQPTRR
jgi:preprotein translocase subunit SecF